jgi:hypothetical protein
MEDTGGATGTIGRIPGAIGGATGTMGRAEGAIGGATGTTAGVLVVTDGADAPAFVGAGAAVWANAAPDVSSVNRTAAEMRARMC